jgi:hypothetical protein
LHERWPETRTTWKLKLIMAVSVENDIWEQGKMVVIWIRGHQAFAAKFGKLTRKSRLSLVARYGYSISFYVHWCSCECIDFTTVRDADELKMFAKDNEDV